MAKTLDRGNCGIVPTCRDGKEATCGSRQTQPWAAITVAEKEWLLYPLGLPGTAVRGPACTVVCEAGGAIPPPTRLATAAFISFRVQALDCRPRNQARPCAL